jgi:hypothetical protein
VPGDGVIAIVAQSGYDFDREVPMGDKSPKAKQRDLKQKDVARAKGAAAAKSKQDKQSRFPQTTEKGKR